MALKPLWREYTAVDIATAAYIAIATGAVLVSFRGDRIPGWPWLLSAHPLIIALWMVGRRDASRHTIFAVMATFYLCYVVFLFFPVAGPRYAFDNAHNLATKVGPARFAAWLLDRGDSWGAAFPSSHVAASVVATGMALRYWRPLGWLLLPFTAGLILAVVYGQFHYAVDALAGLIVAALMLGIMQTAEATAPQRLAVADYGVEPGSSA